MEAAKTRSEVIIKDWDVTFKGRTSTSVVSEPRTSFTEETLKVGKAGQTERAVLAVGLVA